VRGCHPFCGSSNQPTLEKPHRRADLFAAELERRLTPDWRGLGWKGLSYFETKGSGKEAKTELVMDAASESGGFSLRPENWSICR